MRAKLLFTVIFFLFSICSYAQLWDNYDGVGDLSYTSEGSWSVSAGLYVAGTGSLTTPEHSYASYDMTNQIAGWDLSNSNTNEWIGWMDCNRSSISGWGASSYSCGMVLAANSDDFNDPTTEGYAVGFKNTDDELVVFRFTAGIVDGTADLPGTSVEIVNSGYAYSDGDNGVNFYVKLESDGKWTIKYKAGAELSDASAVLAASYDGGSATSSSVDDTYRGTSYKYSGWVYAHNSGGSEEAYFDNYGFSQSSALPVELISFTANYFNNSIQLKWQTATETNNYGFEIERASSLTTPSLEEQVGSSQSSVGNQENLQSAIQNPKWEAVGFVKGAGNSSSLKEYSYLSDNIGHCDSNSSSRWRYQNSRP